MLKFLHDFYLVVNVFQVVLIGKDFLFDHLHSCWAVVGNLSAQEH